MSEKKLEIKKNPQKTHYRIHTAGPKLGLDAIRVTGLQRGFSAFPSCQRVSPPADVGDHDFTPRPRTSISCMNNTVWLKCAAEAQGDRERPPASGVTCGLTVLPCVRSAPVQFQHCEHCAHGF